MKFDKIVMLTYVILISISILSASFTHITRNPSISKSKSRKSADTNELTCPFREFNPYRITKYFNNEQGCDNLSGDFSDSFDFSNILLKKKDDKPKEGEQNLFLMLQTQIHVSLLQLEQILQRQTPQLLQPQGHRNQLQSQHSLRDKQVIVYLLQMKSVI